MYPSRFRYEAPRSLEEAITLLQQGAAQFESCVDVVGLFTDHFFKEPNCRISLLRADEDIGQVILRHCVRWIQLEFSAKLLRRLLLLALM